MPLLFWQGLRWICRLPWVVWSFNNVNSSNPPAVYLSLYLCHLHIRRQVLQTRHIAIVHKLFSFLVRFIPRCFILFDAIVNEIIFLISLSDNLLLLYRSITDFCVLILYPETLWVHVLILIGFLVRSSRFYICRWVTKLCLTLWDPVDCGTQSFPVLHYLLEFAQLPVHWTGGAI